MSFALGQRWISDTENNLGLGTVVAVDHRTVTLLFSAVNETRLYARNDAPVTRVMFNPGDTITSHEGWQLIVKDITERDGLLSYIGQRCDTNEEGVILPEIRLDPNITFTRPQDRLFAGLIDRMDRFALRYRAWKYQSEQVKIPWSGLRGIRASLIPHQLHIAQDVANRYAPRVLLADEVGLGKTIEAGMIIHQMLLTGSANRVLIIVPETLQHQWLVEMLRKFNLRFSLFDDERYAEAILDSDNPFETEQLVICSLNFVYRNKQRLELLCDAQWDVVVVDEAHHLQWSEKESSRAYRAIEELAEHIPSVLLLTATPEQLGQESHFARLRLLDPDRFHDYQEFIKEQKQYQPIANAITLLLSGKKLENSSLTLLSDMVSEKDIKPLLELANSDNNDASSARQQLISLLMDRHGTSRVLFRNSRQGVKGFPQRCLHQIKLTMPEQYKTALKVSLILNNRLSAEQRAQNLLYPEKIYQDLEGKDANWMSFDPRVTWLIDYIKQHRDEKILVICSQASTTLSLESYLREREAILCAMFHEGMTLLERDKAAAWFASQEEGAQVLLCSEIGSEGRNFQFASHLVMFDLPFNPDLLEQRIGRLDRIGQTKDIQLFVPYIENSTQAILLRWYHEGLDAFENTCPTGRAVYDEVSQQLMTYLANPAESEGIDEFIHQTHQLHLDLKKQLEAGRDRLLEIYSNGGEPAQQLANTIAAQDGNPELINFAINLFDIIGINQEDHSHNILILTPSDHMLIPDFPGLGQEGCLVTFDRNIALSREDIEFISWEHPIIRNGLDLILSSDNGRSSVALLKNRSLPAGTMLLELIYIVEAQGPKSLQLNRFLPPTPIRLLLDRKGNNLSDKVKFETFNQQLTAINRHIASKMVNAVQPDIHAMLQSGEQVICQLAESLIDQAKQSAESHLFAELSRLKALKSVNPNIREDEIDWQEKHRDEVLAALEHANWRLDALRLVVVSHQ